MTALRFLALLALAAFVITPLNAQDGEGDSASPDAPPPPQAPGPNIPPQDGGDPEEPEKKTYPEREKQWTTEGFKDAFRRTTKTNITNYLGPPDDASDRQWVYKGMDIHDVNDPEVKYSIVRIHFGERGRDDDVDEGQMLAQHFEFTE